MEEKEALLMKDESSKDEDLDEVPSDEIEMDRDRNASLASCSMARPMFMRERKKSTDEGGSSTCFKNI
jgi:hypothetical protein